MPTQILTGVGAGLASALLFTVVISGSPAALLLSYLAPLPVFLVTLGWRHVTGLIAAATGMATCAVAFRASGGALTGLTYGVGVALPAWWLGYLALLGRPGAHGSTEWYPSGRLLFWLAGVAAFVTLLGVFSIGGSLAAYERTMSEALSAMLRAGSGNGAPALPEGMDEAAFVATVVKAAPLLVAASFVPMQALNLWLAARIVAASGRLARPWPELAAARMPFAALGVFAVAFALATLAGGVAGVAGAALTGSFGAAYALQCLGALHAALRGKTARPFVLATLYALMIPFFVWIVPALAVGGVLETITRAFRRNGAGAPPPPANDA
ncbi:DUF2232 domain-containing protein [Camelimonas abortus]|uniref:DUF2232 domain-containing protein n=1 Tax=Camelimonas abortus TaxID=1017184 RepID=A0ABV7LCR1_9HYPH